MNSRPIFEAKLSALHEFHRRQFIGAPDGVFQTLRPRLAAMRAALVMPEPALPILLSLAERHGRTEVFRAFVFSCRTRDVARPVPAAPVVFNRAGAANFL